MIRLRLVLCTIGLMFFGLAAAHAQSAGGLSSMGRDFYFTYLPSTLNCNATKPFLGLFALATSAYDNTIQVNYFDHQTGKEIPGLTYNILARQFLEIPIDRKQVTPIHPEGEAIENLACHIHSKQPVSVEYFSDGPGSTAMTLILPTVALGKDYVVASWPTSAHGGGQYYSCTPDTGWSTFIVVAVADSTTVTIIPNGTTQHGVKGVESGTGSNGTEHPITITLNRGQTYRVEAGYLEGNDESGSIVHASKPVAVFAGNTEAFTGLASNSQNGADQRNLMYQEMVPVQYLKTKDYIGMPFVDSPTPASDDPTAGEAYRIFAYDSTPSSIGFNISQSGNLSRSVARYQNPPVQFDNVKTGINAQSTDDQRIMVEQYDYKQANQSEPYPAPTEMNVVPLSEGVTTALLSIPDSRNDKEQKFYLNIIARNDQFAHIKLWINGIGPRSVTSLPEVSPAAQIPGHAELSGRRFSIQPGSYYITGDSAFLVYEYGFLAVDPDFDYGDHDEDDFLYEYASPVGQSFGMDGGTTPRVSVDQSCSRWTLTATDTAATDGGLADIEPLNDPIGVLRRRPGSDSGYVSSNVSFDPPNFTVLPGDTVESVKIIVNDWTKDADAWVRVVNVAGVDTIVHMTYTHPGLILTPDSGSFLQTPFGTSVCQEFELRNSSPTGGSVSVVKSIGFAVGNQDFSVAKTAHPLPVTLRPGDSLGITVCYLPKDPAKVSLDTLKVQTDCPVMRAPLIGTSVYPLINAEDYDFGTVVIGDTVCHPIRVWNPGHAPFVLTRNWSLLGSNFSFRDSVLLPDTVAPGQSVALTICYAPTVERLDSAVVRWGSNIPSPFTHQIKDSTRLFGYGVRPALIWDPSIILMASQNQLVSRPDIVNQGSSPDLIDSFQIVGPDALEFKITAYQEAPQIPMVPATRLWIELTWTPDTTKLYDRIDTIIAYDVAGIYPRAVIHGIIGYLGVNEHGSSSPTSGLVVTINGASLRYQLPPGMSEYARAELYDLLGRLVRSDISHGRARAIPTADLAPGTYFLRVSDGAETVSAKCDVVR